MHVVIVPIQIKEGFKDRFIEELLLDAKGSVNDEPGCHRFDVIQDPRDSQPRMALRGVHRCGGFRGPYPGPPLPEVEGSHQRLAG